MQTFELYGVAWLVYVVLGLAFLALVTYKIKNLSWPVKFAIISFLAVGALTPDTVVSSTVISNTVANTETYAPLVITALLKAEVEGSKAIISGLVQLTIIWGIVYFIGMSLRHFLIARAKQ